LIILGIFAISRIVRQSFAPLPAPTAVPVLTTQVVVTTRDIALGSVLKEEDLQLVEMSVGTVPRNALGDVELALGRITTVHLIEGEMVMEHHLADPTNISHDVGYVIGNDQVLMAFPAEDLMSTINILQRDDRPAGINVQNVPVLEIGPNGE
jgi:Flp pilus assembly protein CpaB